VLDVPSAFVFMARTVHDHKFQPQVYWLGMKEGIVSLVWNERLKSAVSPSTVTEVDRVEKLIRSGALQVPRGKF
jgi:basic membrane lipoprotein Med (substrate-binding protein (PBP1-ABC) superfamily)